MNNIDDIISEIENDAARDCVYNHEDLRALARKLKDTPFVAGYQRLGGVVNLCKERAFRAVIVAVEERLDHSVHFKVQWRNGRGFDSEWFSEAEIKALEKLEEQ